MLACFVRTEPNLRTFIRSDIEELLRSVHDMRSALDPYRPHQSYARGRTCSPCHHHEAAASEKYTYNEREDADRYA